MIKFRASCVSADEADTPNCTKKMNLLCSPSGQLQSNDERIANGVYVCAFDKTPYFSAEMNFSSSSLVQWAKKKTQIAHLFFCVVILVFHLVVPLEKQKASGWNDIHARLIQTPSVWLRLFFSPYIHEANQAKPRQKSGGMNRNRREESLRRLARCRFHEMMYCLPM